MPEDKLVMLWIGVAAAALLVIIVFWVLLYAVVRGAVLSALRTHSRELRRQLLRTGAIDVVNPATMAHTGATPTGAAPASSAPASTTGPVSAPVPTAPVTDGIPTGTGAQTTGAHRR